MSGLHRRFNNDTILGFRSEESLASAVDKFNNSQSNYHVSDDDYRVEGIATMSGTVYLPIFEGCLPFENQRLHEAFSDFMRKLPFEEDGLMEGVLR